MPYRLRGDPTREAELAALAAVYRILIDASTNVKEGPLPGTPEDAERRSDAIGAKKSIRDRT